MPMRRSVKPKVVSERCERSESVRKPCAMVAPNGERFARSGSTWIHWKSSIALAKVSMRSWVISSQGDTPTSSPTRFSRSRKLAISELREIGLALLQERAQRFLRLGRAEALAEDAPLLLERAPHDLRVRGLQQALGEAQRFRRQLGEPRSCFFRGL